MMAENKILSLQQVEDLKIDKNNRILYSATHEEVLRGTTTDVYFVKTYEILKALNKENTQVVAEIFARSWGFCGLPEVLSLLKDTDVEVWALQEGEEFQAKEVIMH